MSTRTQVLQQSVNVDRADIGNSSPMTQTENIMFTGTGEIERAYQIPPGKLSQFLYRTNWGRDLQKVGTRYLIPTERIPALLIELRRRGLVSADRGTR